MLVLNIKNVLALRGIDRPSAYLYKHGFSRVVISRLLTNASMGISHKYMEKLCLVLHCTPNDLYAWTPPQNGIDYSKQPLHQLVRNAAAYSMADDLKTLPYNKLDELKAFVDGLKEGEQKPKE